MRRDAVARLLAAGRFAVVKGNASEMLAVRDGRAAPAQRGVDSTAALDVARRAALARAVVTGPADLVSDGRRAVRVDNGHPLLAAVTGSGCCLGTVLAAAVAAYPDDAFVAVVAATAMYGVAAEMAAVRSDVRGPGTFVPAFIDKLHAVKTAAAAGDWRWLALAKVQAVPAAAADDDDA